MPLAQQAGKGIGRVGLLSQEAIFILLFFASPEVRERNWKG